MRTFAERPKSIPHHNPNKFTTPDRATFLQAGEVNASLHLRRGFENQTGGLPRHENGESHEARSRTTVTDRFMHDFARIPIYSAHPPEFQSPFLSFSDLSPSPMLQRKFDYTCGGQCPEGKMRVSGQPLGFTGDLNNDIFQLTPDAAKA